jgi:hypothetical protein
MGTLRRKKDKHGILEDPWKTKVFDVLLNSMLIIKKI